MLSYHRVLALLSVVLSVLFTLNGCVTASSYYADAYKPQITKSGAAEILYSLTAEQVKDLLPNGMLRDEVKQKLGAPDSIGTRTEADGKTAYSDTYTHSRNFFQYSDSNSVGVMRSVSVTITYDTKNKIKDTNFWRSQTFTTVGSRGATSSRDATDAEVTQYLGQTVTIPKLASTVTSDTPNSQNKTAQVAAEPSTKGWKLGIQIGDISPGTNYKGALIENVSEDGLAAKAGILAGDLITKVNGSNALNKDDLVNKIRAANNNAALTLQIISKGKARNIVIQPPKRSNSTSL